MKFIQAGHNWIHDSDYFDVKTIEKNFSNRLQIILIKGKCSIGINEIPVSNYGKNTLLIATSGSRIAYGSDGSENFINDWIELSATPEEIEVFGLDPVLIVPEINNDYANILSNIIRNMAYEEMESPYLYEVATNAHLQLFFVRLAQYVNVSTTKLVKTNYRHPYYAKFVKLRNKTLSSNEEVDISALAAQVNMSESHFRKCYKEIFRTPIHRDLIEHKIEHAQQLLRDSNNYTVIQIADMLGYKNHEHFFRQFKRVTHITPSEYRNSFYETIFNETIKKNQND